MTIQGRKSRRIFDDDNGATAVEFALVLPILVVLLCGIMAYGGYFWMAHSVQQMANDSARAAVAGLDATERETLARSALDEGLSDNGFDPTLTNLAVDQASDRLRIDVTYDASKSVFFTFKEIAPMPNSTIRRSASTRLAGY
jgi:Flp pilus assembly protein TadG